MKKTLLCLLLVVAMLSMTFSAAFAEEEPMTIHWLSSWNENEANVKALFKIVEMYNETHPDINIELETIGDQTAYMQKLKILGASNELPEWYNCGPDSYFESLVDAGYAYNIEDLFEELGVSDKIFGISKAYARLNDGRLYQWTWECNAEYFFYNKQAFADAGIEKVPETIDELLEDAAKLLDAGYIPFSVFNGWMILRYFAMTPFRLAGNDYIMNACEGKESFGSEVGIKAAEYMQKFAKYFQEGWATSDYDTMMDLFTSGQAAMLYNGTWVLSQLVDENQELPEEYGIFSLPAFGDNDATTVKDYFANSGTGTAVRPDAMNDRMKDFLAFFFEHYGDICFNEFDKLPSVMPSDTSNLPDVYMRVMNDAAGVDTYARCWDVVIDNSCMDPLMSETVNLCLGVTTPEEWAANMDALVAEAIN